MKTKVKHYRVDWKSKNSSGFVICSDYDNMLATKAALMQSKDCVEARGIIITTTVETV